jgi:hypothetical protein
VTTGYDGVTASVVSVTPARPQGLVEVQRDQAYFVAQVGAGAGHAGGSACGGCRPCCGPGAPRRRRRRGAPHPAPRPPRPRLAPPGPQNVAPAADATNTVMTAVVFMISRTSYLKGATSAGVSKQPILCMATFSKLAMFK